jgi:hypothetical protein
MYENTLVPLEHWNRAFESRSSCGCMSAFVCFVVSSVGRGFGRDRLPV